MSFHDLNRHSSTTGRNKVMGFGLSDGSVLPDPVADITFLVRSSVPSQRINSGACLAALEKK